MNRETFSIIKKALHFGEYDLDKLKLLKSQVEPVVAEQIELITEKGKNVKFDYKKFLSIEPSPEYKDELVITFLLFVGKTLNIQKLIHMFHKPFSNCIYNWICVYKMCIYSVLSLMYDKKFTVSDMLELEKAVLLLNNGHSEALRQFMKHLNVLSKDVIYESEKNYILFRYLDNTMFGPFVWRMMHFMAEAVVMRKKYSIETQLWMDFTLFQLDITFPCFMCSEHYRSLVQKYSEELKDVNDYPKTWFKLHNDVNVQINNRNYSEVDFERDRKVMQKMLS